MKRVCKCAEWPSTQSIERSRETVTGMKHQHERWEDPMNVGQRKLALLFLGLLAGLVITLVPTLLRAAGDIDEARLKAADSEPQNWFTLGRDQNQTYFSPLAKIDATNVGRLGFAWQYDLGTARGQEATPL